MPVPTKEIFEEGTVKVRRKDTPAGISASSNNRARRNSVVLELYNKLTNLVDNDPLWDSVDETEIITLHNNGLTVTTQIEKGCDKIEFDVDNNTKIFLYYSRSGKGISYDAPGYQRGVRNQCLIVAVSPQNMDNSDRYSFITVNSQEDQGNAVERQLFRWALANASFAKTIAYLKLPQNSPYVQRISNIWANIGHALGNISVFVNDENNFAVAVFNRLGL